MWTRPSAVRQTTHSCPEPPKHHLSRPRGAKCPQLPAPVLSACGLRLLQGNGPMFAWPSAHPGGNEPASDPPRSHTPRGPSVLASSAACYTASLQSPWNKLIPRATHPPCTLNTIFYWLCLPESGGALSSSSAPGNAIFLKDQGEKFFSTLGQRQGKAGLERTPRNAHLPLLSLSSPCPLSSQGQV